MLLCADSYFFNSNKQIGGSTDTTGTTDTPAALAAPAFFPLHGGRQKLQQQEECACRWSVPACKGKRTVSPLFFHRPPTRPSIKVPP